MRSVVFIQDFEKREAKRHNVRVIPDAVDIEFVGADTIAKLSAQTSEGRPVAAWDQRIVIRRFWVFVAVQIVSNDFALELDHQQRSSSSHEGGDIVTVLV